MLDNGFISRLSTGRDALFVPGCRQVERRFFCRFKPSSCKACPGIMFSRKTYCYCLGSIGVCFLMGEQKWSAFSAARPCRPRFLAVRGPVSTRLGYLYVFDSTRHVQLILRIGQPSASNPLCPYTFRAASGAAGRGLAGQDIEKSIRQTNNRSSRYHVIKNNCP